MFEGRWQPIAIQALHHLPFRSGMQQKLGDAGENSLVIQPWKISGDSARYFPHDHRIAKQPLGDKRVSRNQQQDPPSIRWVVRDIYLKMALLPRISGITFSFNMEESCKTGIFSDSVVEPSIQQIHHLPWWCLAQRLCCSRGHRTGANQRQSSNSSPPNWMFKRGFPPVVKHEKFLMKSGCKWPK